MSADARYSEGLGASPSFKTRLQLSILRSLAAKTVDLADSLASADTVSYSHPTLQTNFPVLVSHVVVSLIIIEFTKSYRRSHNNK